MAQLIKSIEGSICDNVVDELTYVKSITGEIQEEDYINMNGFIAYLQNLSRTEKTSALTKPINFGLKNKYNIPLATLNISY